MIKDIYEKEVVRRMWCKHYAKKENEEPCVNCKWLTGNVEDPDFYEKKEIKKND